MDEKTLIALLKSGDRVAFGAVFEKYAARLYRFSFHFFRNEADAEEIVQETFLKIWETRERIDVQQHFNTYLITIAKHQIYDVIKHKFVEQKHHQRIFENSLTSYSIEDDFVLQNLMELLLSCIEQLPPQQREVMLLRNKGLNNQEIAEKLDLSVRTVETHVSHALKILRTYFMKNREIATLLLTLFS